MKHLIIIVCAAALATSCHSSRKTTTAPVLPVYQNDSSVLIQQTVADSTPGANKLSSLLQLNHIDFTTFSAKIDVDAQDDKGKKPGITATFRMIKDSAIWVSLSATFLNIEVYRIFITRDSIIMVNKQDKTADHQPISYLQDISNLPLSLTDLQNLIIGNTIFLDTASSTMSLRGDSILVKSAGKDFVNMVILQAQNLQLLRSVISDINSAVKRFAQLEYSDYRPYSNFYFSQKRRILAVDEKTLDIKLDFRQYEFNKPLSVAFSVPKNYQRK